MSGRIRSLLVFELTGAVFMVVVGSALHFLFDLAGGWPPLALIAAVNESIWEHLKLAFWPGLFWACFAPLPAGLRRRELLVVKGPSLLVTAVLIVTVFSTYTTFWAATSSRWISAHSCWPSWSDRLCLSRCWPAARFDAAHSGAQVFGF